MSSLSNALGVLNNTAALQNGQVYHHLYKRINWNPLHYATLPIKKHWGKIAPSLDKYNSYTRIIQILLGGLGLIVMLDNHKWKSPRWPWAKDGRNNPPPSFTHENEIYSVDELAEKKLMEMLKEMKIHEGIDNDIPWEGKALPKESEDEAVQEAEDQFMDDMEAGVGDIVEEMEKDGVLIPEAQ